MATGATDPSTVAAFNAARAAAAKSGGDTKAGNLKDYDTFAASLTGGNGTGGDSSNDDSGDGGFSRLGNDSLYGGTSSSDVDKARSVSYDVSDFDEKSARAAAIQNASGQLGAIDAKYDAQVDEERKVGAKDLARSNTISALTGFAGSPEGATRAGNSDRRTQTDIDTINSARAADISALYGAIDQNVAAEKQAHLTTQRENAAALLDKVATNAKGILNKFAAQGITWDKLEESDPDTLDKLVQQTGEDAFTLRQLYNSQLGTPPKELYSGWKGDNYVQVEQDPTSGKVTSHTYTSAELGIPKGTNLGTVQANGNVYWYDQDAPLDENGAPKLIRIGSTGSGSADVVTLAPEDKRSLIGANLSSTDISDIEQLIKEGTSLDTILSNGEFTPTQKAAIQKAYGGTSTQDSKLTRANMATFYGLTDDDTANGGFLGIGASKSGKAQLDDVMSTVAKYQALGMSDADILKKLGISGTPSTGS